MSNPTQHLPVMLGEPKLTQAPLADEVMQVPPVQLHVTYINNLTAPVVVEWRNGFKFTLPPVPCLYNNSLKVKIKVIIHRSVKVDMQRLFSVVGEESSAALRLMRDAYNAKLSDDPYSQGGATLEFEYPLSLDDFKLYGGTVYFNDVDTVFSILPYDQVPPHPYGEAGKRLQLIEASGLETRGMGFGYTIDLVDNARKYGDRYINIAGVVYRITAGQDPLRRDGVYVVSNAPAHGILETRDVVSKHYPFEGADEALGIYATEEDARVLGDQTLAQKRELVDLERQLNIERLDLQRNKQVHEREMLDKDAELKSLQRRHEEDMAEMERRKASEDIERQRLKDYYESRSYVRKDSSEALKLIPTIMVGLGAIFMAVRAAVG
jgi:hypothetical protein